MSDFTGYLEGEIAEWMVKDTQMPTPSANIYVGLHTSDPGNTPDGSTEVSAADYGRLSTAPSDWSVLAGDGPTTFENATELLFPAAQNNWGTISHVVLWDSSSGGNAIATYDVSTPKAIDTNDEARFPANDLSFDID
jgi:hypothetical protein